jgi:hypothetical protein
MILTIKILFIILCFSFYKYHNYDKNLIDFINLKICQILSKFIIINYYSNNSDFYLVIIIFIFLLYQNYYWSNIKKNF